MFLSPYQFVDTFTVCFEGCGMLGEKVAFILECGIDIDFLTFTVNIIASRNYCDNITA